MLRAIITSMGERDARNVNSPNKERARYTLSVTVANIVCETAATESARHLRVDLVVT